MSFKQRSSPLKQGLMQGTVINNGMTAAQIAYSNTPAGQAVTNNAATIPTNNNANNFSRPEQANNATANLSNLGWVTAGRAAMTPTPSDAPVVTTPNTVRPTSLQKGKSWFDKSSTNTVDGGPQSTMQSRTYGLNRIDSHNTNFFDRTNGGSMFNNPVDNTITDPSNMFSPLPQLKKEQMEYNKINPKAFSSAGTIGKMMGKSIPNSPFMQMVDPLTGNQIDPTMNQNPNAPTPVNTGAPVPPPIGVQTPISPIYDLNNQ